MSISLFEQPVVPEHRIKVLAQIIAGFQWPDRGSFEKLTKGQQKICLSVAKSALERLAAEGEGLDAKQRGNEAARGSDA